MTIILKEYRGLESQIASTHFLIVSCPCSDKKASKKLLSSNIIKGCHCPQSVLETGSATKPSSKSHVLSLDKHVQTLVKEYSGLQVSYLRNSLFVSTLSSTFIFFKTQLCCKGELLVLYIDRKIILGASLGYISGIWTVKDITFSYSK